MLGSKSDFFFSSEEVLKKTKKDMLNYLELHNTNEETIKLYLDSYNFFIKNPTKFDGATILKDVEVIPNLDIWAMIHDYMYIHYKAAANFKYKYYSDYIFSKELERTGQSWEVSWVRFGLLTLSGILFTPYTYLSGKRMSDENKADIYNLYKLIKG